MTAARVVLTPPVGTPTITLDPPAPLRLVPRVLHDTAALALAAGDTVTMSPDRFRPRAADDDDDVQVPRGLVETNSNKLDKIGTDLTDMRIGFVSLAHDVRALVERVGRHDADHTQRDVERTVITADVERRLRDLEKRSWQIPSLSALLGLAGLALGIWSAFGR